MKMNPAPRYLGLDIATKTGWCLVEGDQIVKSGVRDFSLKKTEHIGWRGIWFYNLMHEIGYVDEIYYEKIHFNPRASGDHGELYKGLLMVMNMYAASYGIPTFGVWPGTLKKNFTGYGHAEKHDMCQAARALGWKGGVEGTAQGHDEVDAIALLVTELQARYNITLKF